MAHEERRCKDMASEIDSLLDDLESIDDSEMRNCATGVVENLLALYAEGLTRILASVRTNCTPDGCAQVMDALANDELVSHLLLLHDLHPIDQQTRVERALEGVRPYLASHGGNVELLAIEGRVARLRLEGSCNGCPGSTVTLKHTIEEAIHKAAPDLDGIETEGVAEPRPISGVVPLSSVHIRKTAGVA